MKKKGSGIREQGSGKKAKGRPPPLASSREDAGGKARLTLGPLLFHWPEDKRRDFYFRIADETDVDLVYVGEAVCSKREAFHKDADDQIIERLERAGKKVALSSLAMVTTPRETMSIKEKAQSGYLVEANDVAAVQVLAGKPFIVGPFINVMNEGTRDYLQGLGAQRIVFASELSAMAIGALAQGAAPAPRLESEVQVFGRQPLSVAMRCYAARAYGRNKDGCRFACGLDPDGLAVDAYDGKPVLTVSGTMTLSHGYVVLLREMKKLHKQGVTHFRLSPQAVDMVRIAALFRAVMEGRMDPESALEKLQKTAGQVPLINGFLHAREGMSWTS